MCLNPAATREADLNAHLLRFKGHFKATSTYFGAPGGGGTLNRTALEALNQSPDLDGDKSDGGGGERGEDQGGD